MHSVYQKASLPFETSNQVQLNVMMVVMVHVLLLAGKPVLPAAIAISYGHSRHPQAMSLKKCQKSRLAGQVFQQVVPQDRRVPGHVNLGITCFIPK